jgi:hypothetical protein
VDLVQELSLLENTGKNAATDGGSAIMKRVWSGKDEDRCISLCERLRKAGIPYRVDQSMRQYLLGVDQRYAIAVPQELFDGARQLIIRGHLGSRSQE